MLTALLAAILPSSACAVTSSLEIPACVDRLEVSGQHNRQGRRLTFDHAFDPPLSKTEVTLKAGDRSEVVDVWNGRPDGGRLVVGAVLGTIGGVLLTSAAYQVTTQEASFFDEQPFYSTLLGAGALGLGGLLAMTGWHPGAATDLEAFCREPARR